MLDLLGKVRLYSAMGIWTNIIFACLDKIFQHKVDFNCQTKVNLNAAIYTV